MAETVQFLLEQMLPEVEDLKAKGLLSEAEAKAVIKRRTHFEYALKRRIPRKADFLRYVEYELNLEALRRRRKARLGTTTSGTSISDHAGVRRVHFIFDRALRKFGGDVRLWLQYFDFAQRAGSTHALGRLLARALQLHPLQPSLWILAASLEYERNHNMVAARALMQRSLRLNGDSEALWAEYLRLELLYLSKVKERRRVLGLADDAAAEPPTAAVDLPKLDEEHGAEDSEALAQVRAESARVGDSTASNAFLAGAVPVAIVKAAMSAFPMSVSLRRRLLEVLAEHDGPAAAVEAIYDKPAFGAASSCKAVLTEVPAAVALVAERDLPTTAVGLLAAADLATRLDAVVALFAAAFKQRPSSALLEEVVATFERRVAALTAAAEEDPTVGPAADAASKALASACERVLALSEQLGDAATSPLIWEARIALLLRHRPLTVDTADEARRLSGRAANAHPTVPSILVLSLQLQQLTRSIDAKALAAATQAALKAVRKAPAGVDTLPLHQFWLQQVLSSVDLRPAPAHHDRMDEGDDDDDADVDRDARRAAQSDAALEAVLKVLHDATKDTHVTSIEPLATRALEHWHAVVGLERSRQLVDRLSEGHQFSAQFWARCAELELAASPRNPARIRRLLERRVSAQPTAADGWLAWIQYELAENQVDHVTTLHQRAVGAVADPPAFMAAYNALKA